GHEPFRLTRQVDAALRPETEETHPFSELDGAETVEDLAAVFHVATGQRVEVDVGRHRDATVEVQTSEGGPIFEGILDLWVVFVLNIDHARTEDRRAGVGYSFLQGGNCRHL